MSRRVALIADDLTGALDGAAPFARSGLGVAVAVDIEGVGEALLRNCDVIAVNTDSRALMADEATARIGSAWAAIAPMSPALVIKKVDSRLKGNVAEEVDALAAASGRTRALVHPAIPSIGRNVRDGQLCGFGVDPSFSIAGRLDRMRLPYHAPDCSDDSTLRCAADEILAAPQSILPVGSRGLSEALANVLSDQAAPVPLVVTSPKRGLLVVVGSRDPITTSQVDHLLKLRPDAVLLDAPDGALERRERQDNAGLIILRATAGAGDTAPSRVAESLADAAQAIVEEEDIGTILACGGDTALAVSRRLGIKVLFPTGEIAPGVPISSAQGRTASYWLLTKSGGFGERDTLAAIVELIV